MLLGIVVVLQCDGYCWFLGEHVCLGDVPSGFFVVLTDVPGLGITR